jgi:hypothetical protein
VHLGASIVSEWSKAFDLDSVLQLEASSLSNLPSASSSNHMELLPSDPTKDSSDMFDDEEMEDEDEEDEEGESEGEDMDDIESNGKQEELDSMQDVDAPVTNQQQKVSEIFYLLKKFYCIGCVHDD